MFVDEVTVRVRAGHGGRGSVAFRSQPFEPQGGPDGGDGGPGGDVVLKANRDLRDLSALARHPTLKADDGQAGAGGRKEGRKAADLEVEVPVGTAVLDSDGLLLGDLAADGDTLVVARGGAGGGGNIHRASSVNRTPTAAGPGEAGEERELRLELRLPVDVALVGPPNAGRSTLLSALTAARPKIADYPNTTREPQLGVMFAGDRRPLTLVEIPDQRFHRHLERARVVLVAVEADRPGDLDHYLRLAGDRPPVIAWTKADLAPSRRPRRGVRVSAETGVGVEELRDALVEAFERSRPRPAAAPLERRVRLAAVPAGAGRGVSVERREWGLEVLGPRVERLLDRYDLDTPAGFDRFQVALDRMGVNAALEEAGARPGETVRIGDSEFEYQP